MFRYKTIIGRRLHARSLPTQRTEAKLRCNVLNRMISLDTPVSARICRQSATREHNRYFIRAPTPQYPAFLIRIFWGLCLFEALLDLRHELLVNVTKVNGYSSVSLEGLERA